MTHQRYWALLVLKLVSGIAIFRQIDAKSYGEDVVLSIPASMIEKTYQQRINDCVDQFVDMVEIAKTTFLLDLSKASVIITEITQTLLSCLWMAQPHSPTVIRPDSNDDEYEDFNVLGLQDNRIQQDYIARTVPEEAIRQITKFHKRLDYERRSKQLRDNLQGKIREFVDSGLYKTDHQTNYGILIKQMLYEICEKMLRRKIRTKVQIIIDKRLNPYINNKISLRLLRSRIRFNEHSTNTGINELLRSLSSVVSEAQASELPDCKFEELEPTIECVFSYVASLVLLEALTDKGQNPPIDWEPFSIKQLDNLELLLLKILAKHVDDGDEFGIPQARAAKPSYMIDVFKVRKSLVLCLHLMRLRYDRLSNGGGINPSEQNEIQKCVKDATKEAASTAHSLINRYGLGRLDPNIMYSLRAPGIQQVFDRTMSYYARMKNLVCFTRLLIDSRLLSTSDNSARFWGWNIVRDWQTNPDPGKFQRMVTLYESKSLANISCHVPKVNEVSTYTIASDECWKPVLENLLIIQHSISLDGLTLDILFWGNPILMNFIWSVQYALMTQNVPE